MHARRPHSIALCGLLILSSPLRPATTTAHPGSTIRLSRRHRGRGGGAGRRPPDGTSERHYFLNIRLLTAAAAPPLRGPSRARVATGDRVGVWGDRLGDEFVVSRHVLMPADETSVTSALIGAPAKPQTAVFVIVDVGGGSNVTNAMATSSVFSPGNNFASVYDKLSFGIMKMSGDVQGPFSYPMSTCDYSGAQERGEADDVRHVPPLHVVLRVEGVGLRVERHRLGGQHQPAAERLLVQRQHRLHRARAGGRAQHGLDALVDAGLHGRDVRQRSDHACTSSEYGNRMTPMGSGCGMLNAHDLWYAQLSAAATASR